MAHEPQKHEELLHDSDSSPVECLSKYLECVNTVASGGGGEPYGGADFLIHKDEVGARVWFTVLLYLTLA